ncbi:hypothetical protein KTT_55730 [Tengunoibacter tsumagoiensis]|uniref:Uncharacterized protein n=1 Tax=Tengunoibacter tsumagoiensis TaxID=2014871 RepID=A0A402A957_9CHLR|nr:hypothetical protein KTT_55730 [Tengunoibacter tsumagoiensis]
MKTGKILVKELEAFALWCFDHERTTFCARFRPFARYNNTLSTEALEDVMRWTQRR